MIKVMLKGQGPFILQKSEALKLAMELLEATRVKIIREPK